MTLSPHHLQVLYQAYCNTHLLWKNADIKSLKQFNLSQVNTTTFIRTLDKQLRLGQLAEQFAFNQMATCSAITILAENIQIQNYKQTVGELDALLLLNHLPIHLEIVYKFYLYDATLGPSEIECWIGPNRKDRLIDKLNKLTQKQFPLLFTNACQHTLKQLNLGHHNFEQQVLFKAQLFVPYAHQIHCELLNKDCITGFYINTEQLEQFKTHKFYIPIKLDWFIAPHKAVRWVNIAQFKITSQVFIAQKRSPLIWIKSNTGKMSKAFLVWW